MTKRWLALGASLALAATLVAGCGGGAAPTAPPTPTIAPTATPAPTPSPTPDPVALAVKNFAAKNLRMHVDAVGTADFGGTTVTQTGTLDVIGDSQLETYEMKLGTEVVQASDVITVGAKAWERVGTGPWHDSAVTNGPTVDALANLTSLTVVGQETLDGTAVIHVRPGPGVTLDPKRWGPSDTTITGFTISLDLWIKPDGTLAKLERAEEWTQPAGRTTIKVKATVTETCSPLPAATTVTAPADAWVAYTSTAQGYTISQPSGFKVETGDANDSFTYGGTIALSVGSSKLDAAMTLEELQAALTSTYAKQVSASLLSSSDTTIGGQPARIAIYKAKSGSGADIRLVDGLLVANGRAWEIYLVGAPETVDKDVAYLKDSLTTFEFVK